MTEIIWSASKTDQAVTAWIFNRGTRVTEEPLTSKPYPDITEQDVLDYLAANDDTPGLNAQFDKLLDELKSPTLGVGLPWQSAFPLWVVGINVAVDEVRVYQNTGYQVVQAHTTQAQWAPPLTPALWKLYVPPSEGPQPWVQPTGSQDAYPAGAQVTHIGRLWTSQVEANVWEPGTNETLWADGGLYP